jgi:glycerol-3-phosphate cytidylyltransferase-like family protein
MFISDLFEATQQQTLVIIPGGFHPFHPGHLSLYRSAQKAFPGATIIYAATDDKKERPFSFVDKEKLAYIAGVPNRVFQLVKSPFVAREITQNYDPNTTVLIFARSEKDRDEPPKPGGVKKNGEPSYLQPYTKGKLAPMSQHGYMAYLPTVQFDAGPSGVTSATQIRNMWPQADDAQKNEIISDLYPRNPAVAREILDKYLGGGLSEDELDEHIGKVKGGYRLYSHTGKNLGTFPSKAGAEKHEREVEYFKHRDSVEESTPVDPSAVQMKKRARMAHPFAKSDEEALALYISDREIRDVDHLEREEQDIEDQIKRIKNQLDQLAESAGIL